MSGATLLIAYRLEAEARRDYDRKVELLELLD